MNAPFVPKSATFFPGFGAGEDHPMTKAFKNQAAAIGVGITALSPAQVDVSPNDMFNVVIPLEMQAARAQNMLDSDLIIAWSAGIITAAVALQNHQMRPDQQLVMINPSVRHPSNIFDQFNLTWKTLQDQYGMGLDTRDELVAMGQAAGYADPTVVVPGAKQGDRLIAVSGVYYDQVDSPRFYPPLIGATLLNMFTDSAVSTEPRARIIKLKRDPRLDRLPDARLGGRTHAQLLEEMRKGLRAGVEVEVDLITGTDHFFSRQEDVIMAQILSGTWMQSAANEIWTRDGVIATTPPSNP